MTKPNCTITVRQDRLLDQLSEKRYASRSEALRTAIEDLHRSLENDGEEPIQQLRTDVKKALDSLDEIAQQIEDLHPGAANSPSQPNAGRRPPQSTSEDQQTGNDDQVDEQVYVAVSKLELAPESAIADECEFSQLRVHESLLRLVDRGLVSSLDDDQTTLYRPAPAGK